VLNYLASLKLRLLLQRPHTRRRHLLQPLLACLFGLYMNLHRQLHHRLQYMFRQVQKNLEIVQHRHRHLLPQMD
jgi:hypothetical protein